ncbi:cytochrome P450 4g15-like isoform X2 [Belonocnema kinseyi]|uniref:cytochrome P450 4g15-like isoform X2 n=1 Tax=Belonocnema kinseyi TaxID=2817044 RepID=UPI00143D74D1|nr:cytochrome P450 4g15-like isoform X2 [Belonocnema kinseyi]
MSVILHLFIAILSLIVLLLFDYVRKIQFYKHAAKIPGPKALPIVGNALRFIGKDSSAAHDILLDIAERYASPCRLWLGNKLFVGIYEPEQLKTLLTSPKSMEKASLCSLLRPWLGNSLLIAPVPIWRAHRKLIQPAFNPQTLRTFVHIFDKHSKSLVQKMEEELEGGEFQVGSYMISYSLNVALESTMGISETSDSKMYTRYTECVNRTMELIMVRGLRLWLHPDIIFNLTKMSKEFYKCITWMHTTAHSAYDTVAVSLQYIMLMLASYPDVQEKLYQELKHIYGKVIPENLSVATEDLKKMKYTERVIQESMRLFPTVPFLTRKVVQDLEIGGYTLPQGSTAFISVIKVHRDEKYWPDPLKFDPDRFLPEEVAKRNPNCYMPFSIGPRNCIGSTYAMMEMKTVVAKILLKYVLKKEKIQPILTIKQRVEIVAHPVEPITIEIVKRLPNTFNT